jgi:hypothetical protein
VRVSFPFYRHFQHLPHLCVELSEDRGVGVRDARPWVELGLYEDLVRVGVPYASQDLLVHERRSYSSFSTLEAF